jgi:hypothetical protein
VIDALLAKVVRDGDDFWIQSETSTVSEISFLLLALGDLPEDDPRRKLMKDLAATLWRCVELPHGRIITHHNSDDSSPDAYQDYFPGQVLLALAVACEQKLVRWTKNDSAGHFNITVIDFVTSDTSVRCRG